MLIGEAAFPFTAHGCSRYEDSMTPAISDEGGCNSNVRFDVHHTKPHHHHHHSASSSSCIPCCIPCFPSHRRNGVPRLQRQTACTLEYPMWVVPLETVLRMKTVEPHQVLKDRGELVMHQLEDEPTVIFVSHQWISSTHPDPEAKQLSVLQQAFTTLLLGGKVRSLWQTSMIFCEHEEKRNWQKVLRNARVWYDYFSIPQTTSDPSAGEDLCKAVRSIPAYVEMCTYTFILAPPLPHDTFVDELGEPQMCDYDSWLSRGWCLTEKMAQFLKVNSNPCVVIRSGSYIRFQDPLDGVRRKIAEADFLCCDLGHEQPPVQVSTVVPENCAEDGMEHGAPVTPPPRRPLECDKVKVRSLLECLINRRLQYEKTTQNYYVYRLLRALRTFFLSGMPHPPDYNPLHGEETLPEFLHAYCFPPTLASCRNHDGFTPLRYAALSGNIPITKELLAAKADVEAPLMMSDHKWGIIEGCNILSHVAIFCSGPASQEIMTLLFEANANVMNTKLDIQTAIDLVPAPRNCRQWGQEWIEQWCPHIAASRRCKRNLKSMKKVSIVRTCFPTDSGQNVVQLVSAFQGDLLRRSIMSSMEAEREGTQHELLTQHEREDGERSSNTCCTPKRDGGGGTGLRASSSPRLTLSHECALGRELRTVQNPTTNGNPFSPTTEGNILPRFTVVCRSCPSDDIMIPRPVYDLLRKRSRVRASQKIVASRPRPRIRQGGRAKKGEVTLKHTIAAAAAAAADNGDNAPTDSEEGGADGDGDEGQGHRCLSVVDTWNASAAHTNTNTTTDYYGKDNGRAPLLIDINTRLKLPRQLYWTLRVAARTSKRRAWMHSLSAWHGATFLLCAAMEGKCRIVRWLLEQKADPMIANTQGDTPLMIAERLGFHNVIPALYEATYGEEYLGAVHRARQGSSSLPTGTSLVNPFGWRMSGASMKKSLTEEGKYDDVITEAG